jgi:cold shock protein
MATGKVKWYSTQKGYGFIEPDDKSGDLFVHVSSLEKAGIFSLNEGQKISYEIATNKGKTSAVNITLVD